MWVIRQKDNPDKYLAPGSTKTMPGERSTPYGFDVRWLAEEVRDHSRWPDHWEVVKLSKKKRRATSFFRALEMAYGMDADRLPVHLTTLELGWGYTVYPNGSIMPVNAPHDANLMRALDAEWTLTYQDAQ